jgi:asparagine synthase (glutamine-hydrolysing)
MDPGFAGAIAGARWRTGFRSRAAALELLCGGGVPRALRERTDKTAFFGPFVHRHSRAFIDGWDGGGVDPELVDPEALRRAWLQDEVDARSYPALQAAWLADQSNRAIAH